MTVQRVGAGTTQRVFRLRHHVAPALVVMALLAALFALATVVFLLVFLVDDEVDTSLGEALRAGASMLGLILAATVGVSVVAMILDRLTLRAPLLIRAPIVLVVPAVGVGLVAAGVDTGYLVLELSVLLGCYWAVFLGLSAVLTVARRTRSRVAGSHPRSP